MFRFVVACSFLALILCAVGCRTCSTPYDYNISAYVERPYDYRGSHPMYRAGSIFGGWDGTHHVVDAHYEGAFVDYYTNAGDYGITTPITTLRYTPSTGTFETRPRTERLPIAIPQQSPEEEGFFTSPRIREPIGEPNGMVPTVEDLINRQRDTMQLPTPITPPERPRTAPFFEDMPIHVIPFSPSDTVPFSPSDTIPNNEVIIPPSTFPATIGTDLPITLEELRRLDPTIQDVQIISIEDVTPSMFTR